MSKLSDDDLVAFAKRVKDKVVFVTGGGSGIGKATALRFAQYGAKISIADIDEKSASVTADEIIKAGGEAIASKCDIVEWDEQVAAYEATLAKFGAVDVVIANAGIAETSRLHDVKVIDGKPVKPQLKTLEVNLTGNTYTIYLAQHYLVQGTHAPGDLKSIVVMSSLGTFIAPAAFESPGLAIYSASKAGLVGVARGLLPFCAKRGIRITLIHPWFADTPIIGAAIPLLQGLPLTPVDRIALTVVRGATDPDMKSSGCGYLLPDDNLVVQIEKDSQVKGIYPGLLEGSYKELWQRLAKVYGWPQ